MLSYVVLRAYAAPVWDALVVLVICADAAGATGALLLGAPLQVAAGALVGIVLLAGAHLYGWSAPRRWPHSMKERSASVDWRTAFPVLRGERILAWVGKLTTPGVHSPARWRAMSLDVAKALAPDGDPWKASNAGALDARARLYHAVSSQPFVDRTALLARARLFVWVESAVIAILIPALAVYFEGVVGPLGSLSMIGFGVGVIAFMSLAVRAQPIGPRPPKGTAWSVVEPTGLRMQGELVPWQSIQLEQTSSPSFPRLTLRATMLLPTGRLVLRQLRSVDPVGPP